MIETNAVKQAQNRCTRVIANLGHLDRTRPRAALKEHSKNELGKAVSCENSPPILGLGILKGKSGLKGRSARRGLFGQQPASLGLGMRAGSSNPWIRVLFRV
jgi:hypothetical protein